MRLVLVSNRVHCTAAPAAHSGGMTVGIEAALKDNGGLWLGWSGALRDDGPPVIHRDVAGNVDVVTLDLPREDFTGYYSGFANQVLWPLMHERPDLMRYRWRDYVSYLRINAMFADALAPLLDPGDVVWVHDYHLIPLGQMLRSRGVGNALGFFLHTPFPRPDQLSRLSLRRHLDRALSGYDLVGFQTVEDLRRFRRVSPVHGGTGDVVRPRALPSPAAGAFGIGIATREFEELAATAEISADDLNAAWRRLGPEVTPIIAVDRLDYSKGIAERFDMFGTFLDAHPEHRGRVSLLQIATPCRTEIAAYRAETARVEAAHAALVAAHEGDGTPVAQLLETSVDRESLAAAYRRSPVAVVTPMCDGMNLVAKEYVAAQDPRDPGVLVLSRFAGAAGELGAGALLVDPLDEAAMVRAFHRALTMGPEERQRRWQAMIEVLRANDAVQWANRYLEALKVAGRQSRHQTGLRPALAGVLAEGGRVAAQAALPKRGWRRNSPDRTSPGVARTPLPWGPPGPARLGPAGRKI